MGRSPRERGSPGQSSFPVSQGGSIPARAGKPVFGVWVHDCIQVDPRASGEACARAWKQSNDEGRSPRERGSPWITPSESRMRRSIPARAGKPVLVARFAKSSAVDPRASGEAQHSHGIKMGSEGRSPRERGSLFSAINPPWSRGSIPARAGKPRTTSAPHRPNRVDPRASGEAYTYSSTSWSGMGRSPRERGSRASTPIPVALTGSIPARAGKPPGATRGEEDDQVDPRASGEARAPDC